MKNIALTLMFVSMVVLGGCETLQGAGPKEGIGGVSGAVLGGVVGAQVGDGNGQLIATGAGALLGAFLGSEIGRSLDKADMVYAGQATQRAHSAPIGESVSWNNPESGNSGTVTPKRDGYSSSGRYCREYEQTIFVDGREQTAVGQACQNTDGTWKVVS